MNFSPSTFSESVQRSVKRVERDTRQANLQKTGASFSRPRVSFFFFLYSSFVFFSKSRYSRRNEGRRDGETRGEREDTVQTAC